MMFEGESAGTCKINIRKELEYDLHILSASANLTHDTEYFGKMDPYCVITVGNEKK